METWKNLTKRSERVIIEILTSLRQVSTLGHLQHLPLKKVQDTVSLVFVGLVVFSSRVSQYLYVGHIFPVSNRLCHIVLSIYS